MRNKVRLVLLCLLFCLVLQSINYASDFNIKIISDKDAVKLGDTIKITISAEGIQNLRPGVNIFLATFDYDRDIFEELNEENIVALNNWKEPTYNNENGKILMEKYENTKEEETLLEISLKVKENANFEETRNKYKKC